MIKQIDEVCLVRTIAYEDYDLKDQIFRQMKKDLNYEIAKKYKDYDKSVIRVEYEKDLMRISKEEYELKLGAKVYKKQGAFKNLDLLANFSIDKIAYEGALGRGEGTILEAEEIIWTELIEESINNAMETYKDLFSRRKVFTNFIKETKSSNELVTYKIITEVYRRKE